MRVVIVEDERPARDRLRRLLQDHPDCVVVGEAGDAVTAAALIDREKPDLCFLDVQMPEGDGFEVLRRITHRPRVIFTTAYDRYAVPAFDVRSVDYLLKPFSRERFAAAMTRAREALQAGTTPAPQDILRLLEDRAGLERSGRAASSPAPPEAGVCPAGARRRRPPRHPPRRRS
jgi:two-component system LytT family response regulator